jgi:hypothetical protein
MYPTVDAIDHVTYDPTIPIANISLTAEYLDSAQLMVLRRACRNAFYAGKLIVTGMSNRGDSLPTYPAALRNWTFATGAVLWDGYRWTDCHILDFNCDSGYPGSGVGSWIDVVAPGGRLIQAAARGTGSGTYSMALCDINYPSSGMLFGGTSAAAPAVAGVAGWLKILEPSLTGEDLARVMSLTARDLGEPGFDPLFGYGLIRADSAAAYVSPAGWRHRLLRQGWLGLDGEGPLVVQDDSSEVWMVFSNTEDSTVNGIRRCMRYHLAGHAEFNRGYVGVPDVWVRRSGTMGLAPGGAFDYDEDMRWGSLDSVTAEGMRLETYVFRVIDNGTWYPCEPGRAIVAYTAIGESGLIGVGQRDVGEVRVWTVPNPARSRVKIGFEVPQAVIVRAEIYDIAGRRVKVLSDGKLEVGRHELIWTMTDDRGGTCRGGVYFVRLAVGAAVKVVRIVGLGGGG